MQTHPENETPEQQPDPDVLQTKDEHLERLATSYRVWLTAQTRRHESQLYHEMHDYAQQASKAVEVGDKRIQTFAPFRYKFSALQTITRKQSSFMALLALVWIGCMVWNWQVTLAGTISLITLMYLSHLFLDVYVAIRSVHQSGEEQIDEALIYALSDADWPPYTVLCPLYKEPQVVPQFVKAIKELDYPEDKLQILFLTEEDDQETRGAILSLRLPAHFHVVTVPDGSPRTKPRACNYGLIEATGAYVVIYDAEDVPDPLQLKKAVMTFAIHDHDLACVQAKLNFYNADQNPLTRWFTAEYSLWFDLILPGLQKTHLAIPLGGTSNHFPTQTLRALGGWDAFNVTEDCDLGIRLSWFNLKTVIVNSTTLEEANSHVKNWIRQRSRWIKGYMQTYLVHMRDPMSYFRQGKLREFFSLQLLVGGKSAILLINPFMWLLFLLTLFFHQLVIGAFSNLFPPAIIFVGAVTLILGNFFYGYIYLLACMRRQQYSLVKWMLLIPCYWFLTSVAACMALYELCTRPHYWQKTIHGLHLKNAEAQAQIAEFNEGTGQSGKEQAQNSPVHTLQSGEQDKTEWQRMAQLAESLTPLSASDELIRGHGPNVMNQVQRYEALQHVPVPSVKDTIARMVEPRRAALLPSEKAYLEQNKSTKINGWLLLTLLTALIMSVGACVYFFIHQQILLLPGSLDMVNSMHRFVGGLPAINFDEAGNTALPLPQILVAAFEWNPFLWQSGLAGSIASMICYIISGLYIFLTARRLTNDNLFSYLGTLIFLLNPTLLYWQSTPIGLTLGILTMTMISYYLLAWIQSDKLEFLLGLAASTCLATLTSYGAWLFFGVVFLLVLGVGLAKHQGRAQIGSNLLVYSILAGLGIALWAAWCWMTLGDPLAFLHNGFLTMALLPMQITNSGLPLYHNAWMTLQFLGLATISTIGPALVAAALLGLILFIVLHSFKPTIFVALLWITFVVLQVIALYSNQLLLILVYPAQATALATELQAVVGTEMIIPVALLSVFLLTTLFAWIRPAFEQEKEAKTQVASEPRLQELQDKQNENSMV